MAYLIKKSSLTQLLYTLLLLVLFPISTFSQSEWKKHGGIINTYAKVKNVNALTKNLVLENSSDENSFQEGDHVLLIQMKGAIANTFNSSVSGNLITINGAGQYEESIIKYKVGNTVTLQSLINTYDASGGAVQLVSLPTSDRVHIISELHALPWNTKKGYGGVVAIKANNSLKLSANINVDGVGFRGGNAGTSKGGCADKRTYITVDERYGNKGEGIVAFSEKGSRGRGAIANGGGGGNPYFAGGGGGGNLTNGGQGGSKDGPNCQDAEAGGKGGYSLSPIYQESERMFLGGGGGGAPTGNYIGKLGGNGGGIVYLVTDTLIIEHLPSKISANGAHAQQVTNAEAGGGGGAGGCVRIEANLFNLNNTLTINVNGGNGAHGESHIAHAGGGGGGTGCVIAKSAFPKKVLTECLPGHSGRDCFEINCEYSAHNGEKTNYGNGIVYTHQDPHLPAEISFFRASMEDHIIELKWLTEGNPHIRYFDIETTDDFKYVSHLAHIPSKTSNNEKEEYLSYIHKPLLGTHYYRLRVVDNEGSVFYSRWKIVSVIKEKQNFLVHHDREKNLLFVTVPNSATKIKKVTIYNQIGRVIKQYTFSDNEFLEIDISSLIQGFYTVSVEYEGKVSNQKLTLGYQKK